MSDRKYKEMLSCGELPPQEDYTYDGFDILDEDAEIEAMIERGRLEYYEEWFRYVGEFE